MMAAFGHRKVPVLRSRLFATSAHAKIEPMRHTIEKGYQAEGAHATLRCNFYCAAAALLSCGFTEHAFVVKMLFLYRIWMDGALAASPRSECQIQISASTIDFARGALILNICKRACHKQMRLLQSDHSM
jgi:hypothetical protein